MTFSVPEKIIFEALTLQIPNWWTEMYDGIAFEEGKNFNIKFGDNVSKTIKIAELIPLKKVVWKVIDALIDIPEITHKSEWTGTTIVWEIASEGNQSTLTLEHIGLTPQLECFNICESGWQAFTDSLICFIQTGVGKPFKTAQ